VIIRVFRPTIYPGKESEFESFLRETSARVTASRAGGTACGQVPWPVFWWVAYVTVWQDVESIRAFAGERWQDAVIPPDEEHLLKDTWIAHYEVLPMSG